ncbi:MAG: DUF309 domain-containing protein [Thermoanaerobaculales bacterium]
MTLSSTAAHRLLTAGLAEYRAGRFWHAHEQWEKLWRRLAAPEKTWVQGLILLAAAAWHLDRNRERVARRLLALAAVRLVGCPELPALTGASELASRAAAAAASAEIRLPPVTIAE